MKKIKQYNRTDKDLVSKENLLIPDLKKIYLGVSKFWESN